MPTYNSKFISTVFLKENTTIEDNVDDTKLVPFIKISQDTHIGQVLGATFYNRLKENYRKHYQRSLGLQNIHYKLEGEGETYQSYSTDALQHENKPTCKDQIERDA